MEFDFNEIEKNLLRTNEKEKTLQDVLTRKKMYYLSDQVCSDISDINEVIEKFKEIKKVIMGFYSDQKLSKEEIDGIRDQFKVANKILSIVREEQERYDGSIEIMKNFYNSLLGVVTKIQYIEDIDRRVYPEGYDSRKKYAFVLNKTKFENALDFIEGIFNYEDYKFDENQSSLLKSINFLVYLLAYSSNNLVFGIPYIDKPYAIDTIIKLHENIRNLIEPVTNLRKNSYFSDNIEGCLEDLDKIEEKLKSSGKDLIGINGFTGRRDELQKIDGFLSNF